MLVWHHERPAAGSHTCSITQETFIFFAPSISVALQFTQRAPFSFFSFGKIPLLHTVQRQKPCFTNSVQLVERVKLIAGGLLAERSCFSLTKSVCGIASLNWKRRVTQRFSLTWFMTCIIPILNSNGGGGGIHALGICPAFLCRQWHGKKQKQSDATTQILIFKERGKSLPTVSRWIRSPAHRLI